jgi:multicomponent Na+:H+ antiporter subunit E
MSSNQKSGKSQTVSRRSGMRRPPNSDSGVKYLILLLINIVVALIWPIFVPIFGALDYVIGYLVGLAFLTLIESSYSRQNLRVFSFLLYALWEIVLSSIHVAIIVLQPRARMKEMINAAVVGVPLSVSSDIEIAILASLISLTPGTLSIELSPNRGVLYVHVLSYRDADEFRKSVKDGFERRLLEITRGSA